MHKENKSWFPKGNITIWDEIALISSSGSRQEPRHSLGCLLPAQSSIQSLSAESSRLYALEKYRACSSEVMSINMQALVGHDQ